jgi:glycosyltransferase involved in cell wall biosynthesis
MVSGTHSGITPRASRPRPLDPQPACSVVMAAYNAGATIAHSITSVLGQTWRDLELIVIDDGSTDDTAVVADEYAADRRVRVHRQANAGPANARNIGIELARGTYVSILDSDDLWLPRYLELMVGALEAAPNAAFAYTRAWVLEHATNRIRRDTWPVRLPSIPPGDGDALLRALVLENFVCSSTTIRRDVLSRVGGYDPWVAVAEDYELWLRIAAAGYGATQVDTPLLVRSDRPDSLTKDGLAMCTGKKRAFQRLLTNRLRPEIRVLAEQGLAHVERARRLRAGERRATPAEYLRRVGGLATRRFRHRSHRRHVPPAEVAASLPGLGRGRREGTWAEWLPISSERRAAAPRADHDAD